MLSAGDVQQGCPVRLTSDQAVEYSSTNIQYYVLSYSGILYLKRTPSIKEGDRVQCKIQE